MALSFDHLQLYFCCAIVEAQRQAFHSRNRAPASRSLPSPATTARALAPPGQHRALSGPAPSVRSGGDRVGALYSNGRSSRDCARSSEKGMDGQATSPCQEEGREATAHGTRHGARAAGQREHRHHGYALRSGPQPQGRVKIPGSYQSRCLFVAGHPMSPL